MACNRETLAKVVVNVADVTIMVTVVMVVVKAGQNCTLSLSL